MSRRVDQETKVNFIKTNFPWYKEIDPLFDFRKVEQIKDEMLKYGIFKHDRQDLHNSVKNLILMAKNQYNRRPNPTHRERKP